MRAPLTRDQKDPRPVANGRSRAGFPGQLARIDFSIQNNTQLLVKTHSYFQFQNPPARPANASETEFRARLVKRGSRAQRRCRPLSHSPRLPSPARSESCQLCVLYLLVSSQSTLFSLSVSPTLPPHSRHGAGCHAVSNMYQYIHQGLLWPEGQLGSQRERPDMFVHSRHH